MMQILRKTSQNNRLTKGTLLPGWLIMLAFMLALVYAPAPAYAQGEQVAVPDLSRLTVPQAAAQLNRLGLRLGAVTARPATDETLQPAGTIDGQSIDAGEFALPGTAIDVSVLSNIRVSLIYDDNDLTFINTAGETLDLRRFAFNSSQGQHRFNATRWRDRLNSEECGQVWSIGRQGAKATEGCRAIYWLTTNNTSEHFWTQLSGAQEFAVVQDGTVRGTCPAAPANSQDNPLTCQVYIAGEGLANDVTDFVYFAYTPDRFTVINTTDDSWMPLTETPIYNYNPQIQIQGVSLLLGDAGLFRNPDTVAQVERLAPGQCLMLTTAPLVDADPPQDCDLIAQRELSPGVIFWMSPFEVDSPFARNGRATCPAAVEGRLTICVMPRLGTG